jgi:hypothetical protein
MNAIPFESSLNAFKSRTPFRPFTVALVNGDRFEVDFPGALSVRDGAAVFIASRGIPWIFDHESVSQFVDDLLNKNSTE